MGSGFIAKNMEIKISISECVSGIAGGFYLYAIHIAYLDVNQYSIFTKIKKDSDRQYYS